MRRSAGSRIFFLIKRYIHKFRLRKRRKRGREYMTNGQKMELIQVEWLILSRKNTSPSETRGKAIGKVIT